MHDRETLTGVVGPFAGLDLPWLLQMRAKVRRDHPFLIWAPFDAPARTWSYGEFHDRVGALAAGLAGRGVRPGEYVLIHLDNCIEAMLAWFACVELGAVAVTTNTRSAAAEVDYFADHCGAVAAIPQPAQSQLIPPNFPNPAPPARTRPSRPTVVTVVSPPDPRPPSPTSLVPLSSLSMSPLPNSMPLHQLLLTYPFIS